MKALVTGGLGYIGSHVVEEISSLCDVIVIVDNLANSDLSTFEQLLQLCSCRLEFHECDVVQTERLTQIMRKEQIDTVIHMAGLKSVAQSVVKPLLYYKNNVLGSVSLFEAMQVARVKRLVFSSSATVYGMPAYLPINERHPRSALNPYGRTKLVIEQVIEEVVKSEPDLRVAVLRYFNPLGAHDSLLIGERVTQNQTNVMPKLIASARSEKVSFVVYGDDYETKDGTCERDFIHISDLAKGHCAALRYLDSQKRPVEFFNLGTGESVSVRQLIKTFEQESGTKINVDIGPRRTGDVDVCFADATLAEDVLGWKATRDLSDMCRSAWGYHLSTKEN